MVEPHSSNFRVITTIFLCVRIFRRTSVVYTTDTTLRIKSTVITFCFPFGHIGKILLPDQEAAFCKILEIGHYFSQYQFSK